MSSTTMESTNILSRELRNIIDSEWGSGTGEQEQDMDMTRTCRKKKNTGIRSTTRVLIKRH